MTRRLLLTLVLAALPACQDPVALSSPFVAVRTDSTSYARGGQATILLTNLSDSELGFAPCVALQVYQGTDWVISPASPRLCILSIGRLPVGQTRQLVVALPQGITAGMYHVVALIYDPR